MGAMRMGTIRDLERIHATRVVRPGLHGGATWLGSDARVELSPTDYETLHQLALQGVVAHSVSEARGPAVRSSSEAVARQDLPHRPPYYDAPNGVTREAIVNGFRLGPWEADVLKYILRAGRKGPKLADLNKARESLDAAIRAEADKVARGEGSDL